MARNGPSTRKLPFGEREHRGGARPGLLRLSLPAPGFRSPTDMQALGAGTVAATL
jgi:hypothetical protein